MTVRILEGDCRDVLHTLPDESVHCCVTSPPYFGLRDYGVEGQMGLEATPDAFVAGMVEVFREVRRVLRDDGTLWLNIGDSYANDSKWGGSTGGKHVKAPHGDTGVGRRKLHTGLKGKDLIGVPWLLAFALRADGWYLRQDIIWSKPNPMPESVRDRCTKAHEYLFLLSKSQRYYYDAEAVSEQATCGNEFAYAGDASGLHSGESHAGSGKSTRRFKKGVAGWAAGDKRDAVSHNQVGRATHAEAVKRAKDIDESARSVDSGPHSLSEFEAKHGREYITRNKRSVWTIPTQPFKEAHFATFPPDLVEPCILAGCPLGGTVLDPFGGAGTTGLVADRLQRNATLIELNHEYAAIARHRIHSDAPLFAEIA